MDQIQIYIAIVIIVFAIIALLFLSTEKRAKSKKLTPLTSLAFAFVIASILFEDNRLIGYGLIGVGIIIAFIDTLREKHNK